jgi:dTDP-4-dehydrorhamnose 3,5-epimerase
VRFTPTGLDGAWLVDLDPIEDERGFFARAFGVEEFGAVGAETVVHAVNISFNRAVGTLRGMHFQAEPHGEAKLVRCTAGAIFDVIVDLRPGSPTRARWYGARLDASNRSALYIPRGVAHGFQTLEPDSEVLYLMSSPYVPEAARGVRWNDPAFGIDWPEVPQRVINDRDRTYPDYVGGGE